MVFVNYFVAYATMDGSNEESSAIGINEPEISGNFDVLTSYSRLIHFGRK